MSLIALTIFSPVVAHAGPANDNFTDATQIGSLPFSATDSNVGATMESGEPGGAVTASCPVVATIWYQYTSPSDAELYIDTASPDISTTVAVYSGDSLASLSMIDCNDYRYGDPHGGLPFGIHAGQTIAIQVGTYMSPQVQALAQTGRIQVSIRVTKGPLVFRPPANDAIGDATDIANVPFNDWTEIDTATREPNEPSDCVGALDTGGPNEGTVWYRLQPTTDEALTVSLDRNDAYYGFGIFERRGVDFYIIGCKVQQSSFSGVQEDFLARGGHSYYVQVFADPQHNDPAPDDSWLSLGVYPTSISNVRVSALQATPVSYETDLGDVPAPFSFDIHFTIAPDDSSFHGYVSWVISTCPGKPGAHGSCSPFRSGESCLGCNPDTRNVTVPWSANGDIGDYTIRAEIHADGFVDPNPEDDVMETSVSIGPSGTGFPCVVFAPVPLVCLR